MSTLVLLRLVVSLKSAAIVVISGTLIATAMIAAPVTETAIAIASETIVSIVPISTVALLIVILTALRISTAASNESRQAATGILLIVSLLWLTLKIGLRLILLRAGLMLLTLNRRTTCVRLRVWIARRTLIAAPLFKFFAAFHVRALIGLLRLMRVLLCKLSLRRRDQPKIMFGMLQITLGRDGIAGSLRIAGKLDIFFRDMMRGSTHLHIGAVRFINASQGIMTAIVTIPAAHPLLLLVLVMSVSHCLESLSIAS